MSLIENLRSKVRASKPEIVFPEGDDPRILRAAIRLNEDGDIKPIVLGDKNKGITVFKATDLKEFANLILNNVEETEK